MVQDTNRPGDHFPPRSSYWTTQDRFPMDSIADESRFTDSQDVRRPPMAIDKALREYCALPAEYYVVIPVIGGNPTIFTAPHIPSIDIKKFLDVDALSRELRRAQAAANPPHAEPDFSFDQEVNQYSMPADSRRRWAQDRRYGQPMGLASFEDDGNYKARKRPRASIMRREPEEYEVEGTASSSPSLRAITVSDSDEVWKAYDERFKSIQQSACKLIAKAWVKAVEPKKQSTHPYTGADEKKPDWWPKAWGPNKEQKVRHKEPDHLYKRERVHLLIHILRMVVEPPHKQHHSIRKLYLNVSKLEEVTNEALSSFFTDKDNPGNFSKKPYLKEIFKVAKMEERYKDGQIDESTTVYVMTKDKAPLGYLSDNEDGNSGRDDGEPNPASHSSSSSPQRPSISQTLIAPPHSTDQSPTTQMSSDAFADVGVRGSAYSQPVLSADLAAAERQSFVETPTLSSQATMHSTTSLGLHDMYNTSPHDTSRRSSMFTTPSEYQSPATPTMYSTQWQTGSAAPSSAPVYASFPSQGTGSTGGAAHQHHQHHQHHHQPFVTHSGIAIPQPQPYMNTSDFTPHGGMLRPLGSSYPGYMSHDTTGHLTAANTKTEPLPRHAGQ
ncbi:hypothetical protein GGR52DRAFT_228936 [Hypoxylon sp. FL1284]|nr:hypothetical protein GGR52DRAFT_228936 [Hypoxylon sp. FL1284]